MTRQAIYEENMALQSELGELDGCEAFQLFDEEQDLEREWPVVAKIWRGLDLIFPEQVKEGENDDYGEL